MPKRRDRLKKARRRARADAAHGGFAMSSDDHNPSAAADTATEAASPEAVVETAVEGTQGAPIDAAPPEGPPAPAERVEAAIARGADAAGAALTGSAEAIAQYNAKVLDVMRTNMAAASAHASALAQAKSVPELMAINADHMRRQIDNLTGQGRELTVLGQRVALEALQPLRNILQRR